jgi:hypothetical protein
MAKLINPGKVPFRPHSNNCYFLPRLGYPGTTRSRGSLLVRGLVVMVGKTKTGRYLYNVTDLGRQFANDYNNFMDGN